MPKSLTRAVTLPLIIAAALAVAGCAAPAEETSTPDAETSASAPADESSDAPMAQPVEKGEIFATQEVTLPKDLGTATVEIEPLRVDGKVQVLTFHVTPHLVDEDGELSLSEFVTTDTFQPRLTDAENLKEYNTLGESISFDRWASESLETVAKDGETFTAWAVLAAPEDDVETFDVTIHDRYPRFLDVPVEK